MLQIAVSIGLQASVLWSDAVRAEKSASETSAYLLPGCTADVLRIWLIHRRNGALSGNWQGFSYWCRRAAERAGCCTQVPEKIAFWHLLLHVVKFGYIN
jgi:hypothetical protein